MKSVPSKDLSKAEAPMASARIAAEMPLGHVSQVEIEDNDHSEDDDDGPLLEPNAPARPRKISDKKRADIAVFDTWIEESKEQLSLPKQKKQAACDAENGGTSRNLPAVRVERVIEGAREYQIELFERAKKKNTIAVLDTGTGKTLISILLIRYVIEKELEARAQGKEHKITFFLVHTVTLVWQQTRQLEANLEHPIKGLFGDAVDHLWGTGDYWAEVFRDNMVVVCTAEILNKCLHHSYINMGQINLLVFDEAHHTKKNHPYARIIRNFYVSELDVAKRPRVFGMTASPVDAKTDKIERKAMELERLLHSEIATISDPKMLASTGHRAEEVNATYTSLVALPPTDLCRKLDALIGDHKQFKKAFAFARHAVVELGPWCADRYWGRVFRDESTARLEGKTESNLTREVFPLGYGSTDHVEEVRAADRLVRDFYIGPAVDEVLSSKTRKLLDLLEDYFGLPGNTQCIVFVNRRDAAAILEDLMQQPNIRARIPNLKAGVLIGSGSDLANSNTSSRRQETTVRKFRHGELNCLFATSIAEEGLDIPGCNVVIRFDLYDTTIQYIQSRGRARMANSVFISMTEHGNEEHRRRWSQTVINERRLRQFCSALPEDRNIHKAEQYDMDALLRGEQGQMVHVVKSTGARLTYRQSLVVLAEFVAHLPHPPETSLLIEYVIVPALHGGFQAEVCLPAASPIKGATGRVHRTKQAAKCSAAFETCLLLLEGHKYLDGHLRPTFAKKLPAMRNARLAVSSKKKTEYNMRLKPELWSALGTPAELFVTAITLSSPEVMYHASRPLLLLTRQPLPAISSFPLFFGKGRRSEANCIPISGKPITPTNSELEGLCAFTLRVFRDLFSKEYEATGAEMPYFLAPATKDHKFPFVNANESTGFVDWQVVWRVQKNDAVPYSFDEPDGFFQGKYVSDPFDGSRKFFLRRVRRDLNPQDPVPDWVPSPTHRGRKTAAHTISNYSNSLWSAARSRFTPVDDQPVVEAELIPLRRNLLDEADGEDDLRPKTCFLVLQLLTISQLPVETVAMAYSFPAVIHRLENSLIALDACRMLGLDIQPDLALMAMTKDSDNSDEHDEEPVDFQHGMGQNYERLEFIGDTFLKMATTIALYTLIPDSDEFEYHVERMVMICNKNLFNHALNCKLEEYIRSKSFSRRTWYPPGLTLKKGKRPETEVKHALGDKSIADVCEALIGASYITTRGQNNFDMAVKAVSAMVKSNNHKMSSWGEYHASYRKPGWQTAPTSPAQVEVARQIYEKMGYKFRDPRLLRCAFTHPSYPRMFENLPSYQRLEFLGDSLLDMVCVDYLFHENPNKDPQWLTEHKMAMVSNQFFGCLAVDLGFHRHLAHLNSELGGQIVRWVDHIQAERELAEEDALLKGLGREQFRRDYWVNVEHPPKCLPDILEAYVGAVFVDSGYDYSEVERFFERHMKPYFADMRIYDTFSAGHPVTCLANLMRERFGCSDHRIFTKEIADLGGDGVVTGATKVAAGWVCHGKVRAHATAASGRYAKVAAAKKAMAIFQDMDPVNYRAATRCDCRPEDVILELTREKRKELKEEDEGEECVAAAYTTLRATTSVVVAAATEGGDLKVKVQDESYRGGRASAMLA